MPERDIRIFEDASVLAQAAAELIVARAREAVASADRFTIALSGGSTPRAVHEALTAPPQLDEMPWSKTYFFWGDDRAVPMNHPDSNYRMADESLLHVAPIPPANIKPMPSAGDDLDAAAEHYERVIRSFVPGTPPRFDLVLLGMGPDGHTASLFPHSPALAATDRLVVATSVAPLEPQVRRLSFTTSLINAATTVLFLVAGESKAATLARVLEGPPQPDELPSQRVAPTGGELIWLLDRAAARELRRV